METDETEKLSPRTKRAFEMVNPGEALFMHTMAIPLDGRLPRNAMENWGHLNIVYCPADGAILDITPTGCSASKYEDFITVHVDHNGFPIPKLFEGIQNHLKENIEQDYAVRKVLEQIALYRHEKGI